MPYGRSYLTLVNDVLAELREPTVTTVSGNLYSSLIGRFVNSCKREVEAAWRWSMLRTSFTVPTVVDQVTYNLTGTDERVQVLDAWNTTTDIELKRKTWAEMNEIYYGATPPRTGAAEYWTPNGIHSSTGAYQFDIYPRPTAVESLVFNVYRPQLDLSADADVMLVPYQPVVDGALARARYERGEDGGVSAQGQNDYMLRALANHLAIDANQHPEDLIWVAC